MPFCSAAQKRLCPLVDDIMRTILQNYFEFGCDSGGDVNVPIQRTAHLFSVIPANDNKESVFRHLNFSSLRGGIEPRTFCTRDKCTNH